MENLYDKLTKAMKDTSFYVYGQLRRYNDEDYEIDAFAENFLLENGATAVRIEVTDAFESTGYDASVLSAAWLDDGGLELGTWLLEMY